MPPDMNHIILANIYVKLYSLMFTFCKVINMATDLKEGESFNSNFLLRSFLHYDNWPTFTEVITKIKVVFFLETWGLLKLWLLFTGPVSQGHSTSGQVPSEQKFYEPDVLPFTQPNTFDFCLISLHGYYALYKLLNDYQINLINQGI